MALILILFPERSCNKMMLPFRLANQLARCRLIPSLQATVAPLSSKTMSSRVSGAIGFNHNLQLLGQRSSNFDSRDSIKILRRAENEINRIRFDSRDGSPINQEQVLQAIEKWTSLLEQNSPLFRNIQTSSNQNTSTD